VLWRLRVSSFEAIATTVRGAIGPCCSLPGCAPQRRAAFGSASFAMPWRIAPRARGMGRTIRGYRLAARRKGRRMEKGGILGAWWDLLFTIWLFNIAMENHHF